MSGNDYNIWVGGHCVLLVDKLLPAEQLSIVFGTQRVAEISASEAVDQFTDSSAWESNYLKKQHELGWSLITMDSQRNKYSHNKPLQPVPYVCDFFASHIPEALRPSATQQLHTFFTLPATQPLFKSFLAQAVAHRAYAVDTDSLAVELRMVTRSMQLYSARFYLLTTEAIEDDWHMQSFDSSKMLGESLEFGADSLLQRVADAIKSDLIGWLNKSQAGYFKKIDSPELNRQSPGAKP